MQKFGSLFLAKHGDFAAHRKVELKREVDGGRVVLEKSPDGLGDGHSDDFEE